MEARTFNLEDIDLLVTDLDPWDQRLDPYRDRVEILYGSNSPSRAAKRASGAGRSIFSMLPGRDGQPQEFLARVTAHESIF